ncbi:hypothetical protein HDU81_002911 [Chytriomyces hyalinus]|nr:hypothetical protein HDU81_002911 [Chytriomyces hyalinus]
MRESTLKNDIHVLHQNLETAEPQEVAYSLDKYEVDELSKFADVRFASGPNQIRQIPYAVVDEQRKTMSIEAEVVKSVASKAAPLEERFALSRHETETAHPMVSGPFGIRQIPFGSESSVVAPATKMAKPVPSSSTIDSIATRQSSSAAQPLYSLDWNETQNAWKYVLAASSKQHLENVGTAVKEAMVPAPVPRQAAGVSSSLFFLDQHEVQNVWKIAPLYRKSISHPEASPTLPAAAVPAMKSAPVSSSGPVKSTNGPLFALSCSDFESSQLYLADMMVTGPMGVRQIPYASESAASNTTVPVPVAACNSNPVAKTGKKNAEKKNGVKVEEKQVEEKHTAKIEKAETKPVAATSSAPVKSIVMDEPVPATDSIVASKMAPAKLENPCAIASQPQNHTESRVLESVHGAGHSSTVHLPLSPDLSAGSSSPVFLGGDPAEVFNPYANPLANSRSNRSHGMHSPPESRLNPNAAVWEPSSFSSGTENGTTVKGLNPFAPTFQVGAFDDGYGSVSDTPQYPNVARTTSGGGNGDMAHAGGRSGNNGTKNSNKAKGKGKRSSKDVAAVPTGPTLADYFKVDKKKGSVSVIEKVAVPTVDAIVPKKRGSSPTVLSAEKSLQVLPQLYKRKRMPLFPCFAAMTRM